MSAKELVLRPVPAKAATEFIRRHHYSGSTARNSSLHIGAYWHGSLEGCMQLGPPLDKSKLLGLVRETPWDGVVELNRMAFTDRLPRNSESRALSVMVRLVRRHAPRVKWIVSFADAAQCGDGTIYRASGFILTAIRASRNLARFPDGTVIHKMTLESVPLLPRAVAGGRSYYDVTGGRYDFRGFVAECGGEIIPGHQLRYVRFVDPTWRDRLTVDPVPFSAIAEAGASMYRGVKV